MSSWTFFIPFLVAFIVLVPNSVTAGETELNLRAPAYQTERDSLGRTVLKVNGWVSSGEGGEPSLPVLYQRYLLPPDAELSSISFSIVSVSEREVSIGRIVPACIFLTDGLCKPNFKDGENPVAYGSDRFYPSDVFSIVGTGAAGRWRFVQVRFSPFRYNPKTGILRIADSVKVKITWNEGKPSPCPVGGEEVDASLFSNYEQMKNFYETKVSGWMPAATPCDILIIACQSLINSNVMNNYIQHRTGQGYSVGVISVEDIAANYTGAELADKIRECIKDYYTNNGMRYVILVGDPDPDDNSSPSDSVGDVPMKMCWARKGSNDQDDWRQSPTDYYYADLTGNWDADGDGYFGEAYKVYDVYGENGDLMAGGIDVVPEVVVGRVPFSNSADVEKYFQKVIEYEAQMAGYIWGTGSLEWRKKGLVAALPMDADTPSYQLGELMKQKIFSPPGYSTVRAYKENYGLYSPPEIAPCNESDFCTEWKKGYGIVFWTTHGLEYSAGDVVDTSRVIWLDDTKPSIAFAFCCKNGTPEVNCLAKRLLLNGTLAVFASTRVIWYVSGWELLNQGGSHSFGYELVRRTVEGESLGKALENTRLWYIDHSPKSPYDYFNIFAMVLYGDPLLRIGVLDIRPLNLPRATTGKYYEVQFKTIGGDGFNFGLLAGSTLPGTLSLSPDGLLSGSVSVSGRYQFTICAEDSTGAHIQRTYILDVRQRKGAGCLGYTDSFADNGSVFSLLLVPILLLVIRFVLASHPRKKRIVTVPI
jgi:hypothetical protein